MTAVPLDADMELFVRPCRDCDKPIMWGKTVASGGTEWMPIDADPVDTGNVIAFPDPHTPRRLLVDVIPKLRRAGYAAGGWKLRQHHRLSCPRADEWARMPKHKRPQPTGVAPAPTQTQPVEEGTLW